MHKFILILLFTLTFSQAQEYPELFEQMGTPLYKQIISFERLVHSKALYEKEEEIKRFNTQAEKLMQEGLQLDKNSSPSKIKAYLISLRKLQKQYDSIEQSYKKSLYKSIYDSNTSQFKALLKSPLTFIGHDARLKEKVVNFSQTHAIESDYLTALCADYKLDESSYAYLDKMFQLHRQNLAVSSRETLETFVAKKDAPNTLEVFSLRTTDGFDIYVENNAPYTMSIQLQATVLENLSASHPLPYQASISPQSREKILHFSIIDRRKPSKCATRYHSMLGSVISHYDENYLYALPFARGKSYLLSQGFHGTSTHKGKSAYALDFPMPIGTPVHAMRDGIVIATESEHTEHGFSEKYANKANYVIIQHDDGTMAMYGHLNTDGVRVNVGDRVYKHAHIGYSGNTGYSSGPHLHVHISAIQSFSSGGRSVPFVFKAARGVIKKPTEKEYYKAN